LPVNEDPDSCVRKYGLEGFSQLVSKALTVIEYQLESLKKKNDLTQTDGRLQFGNEAIKILRQLDSSVEIDYYTKIIAGETGINQEVLRREVIRSKQKPAGNQLERIQLSKEIQSPNKIPKAYQKAQELAVRYCLQSPDVIGNFPVAFLNDEFLKELIGFISKKMEASGKIEINQLMGHFDGSAEIQKIVEFMMNEEAVSRSDYQDALDIMNRFYHETLLEKISRQIKIQSTNGNDEAVAKLTTELIEIKKTMKEKREALK
jgi:DNA primase